jgi:hypothetical protein
MNNAGTIELAAVNISGGTQLDETNLISTTAEGGAGAADSASVIYSTTARTSLAYRVIGYIESTQATAGTWATAPSTIQGYGGQALNSMSSIGYSQTWQSPSRALATTYYNTTSKPIFVNINYALSTTGGHGCDFIVAGVTLVTMRNNVSSSGNFPLSSIVPPGVSYILNGIGSGSLSSWLELR